MKRTLFLVLTILLVLAGSTSPVLAKDDGKHDGKDDAKVAAESCKKDGWRSLTTEEGEPFKNQGQCNKYAKQGGKLVEIDDDDSSAHAATSEVIASPTATSAPTLAAEVPSLKIVDGTKPWDGYLQGSGFTPGETLTKVTFASNRETLNLTTPVGTVIEQDGTFTTERIIYWCSEFDGHSETTGTVTVEDSSGKTYSQTFDMAMHCLPKP